MWFSSGRQEADQEVDVRSQCSSVCVWSPNLSQTSLPSLEEQLPVDASEPTPAKAPQPGRKLRPSRTNKLPKREGSDGHGAGHLLVVDDEVRVALVVVEDDVDLRVHPVVHAGVKKVTGGVTGVDGRRPPHGGIPHGEPAEPEEERVSLVACFWRVALERGSGAWLWRRTHLPVRTLARNMQCTPFGERLEKLWE